MDVFCDTILSILRGRELGTVILSTQDPTMVPPEIISSMGLVLCHKFTSHLWLQYLQANFGLGLTRDLQQKLTCLEPNSGIAIFASGHLVDYGNNLRREPDPTAPKSYERSTPPDGVRATADISPPGTSSSMTLVRYILTSLLMCDLNLSVQNVPEITLEPPPGLTVNPQSSYANVAGFSSSSMLASPTAGTDTTASTPSNPNLIPAKIPLKRFRMLFIAIEAIYVMLNLKTKKVLMSAITTRLTEEDLLRMQVTSANEAVEKAQEAGLVKVEGGSGGSSLVFLANDEVRSIPESRSRSDGCDPDLRSYSGQGHARY